MIPLDKLVNVDVKAPVCYYPTEEERSACAARITWAIQQPANAWRTDHLPDEHVYVVFETSKGYHSNILHETSGTPGSHQAEIEQQIGAIKCWIEVMD